MAGRDPLLRLQRRGVALGEPELPRLEQAAHDLPAPRLGQGGPELDLLRSDGGAKARAREGEELRRDLLAFARTRLGAVVAPKEIAFAASLPKTRSGKIMRRLLKARELGLPEGDISTLEGADAER